MDIDTRVQVKFFDKKSNSFTMYPGTIRNIKYDIEFDDGDFIKNVKLDEEDYKNKNSDMEWSTAHDLNNAYFFVTLLLVLICLAASWCV